MPLHDDDRGHQPRPGQGWRSLEAGASPLNAVWSGLVFGVFFGIVLALSNPHRAIGTDALVAAGGAVVFALLSALVIVVRTRAVGPRR